MFYLSMTIFYQLRPPIILGFRIPRETYLVSTDRMW